MKKTKQCKKITNEKSPQTKRAKNCDLFNELLEVVRDSFVATYEIETNSIIMRIINGQKFRISVEEVF